MILEPGAILACIVWLAPESRIRVDREQTEQWGRHSKPVRTGGTYFSRRTSFVAHSLTFRFAGDHVRSRPSHADRDSGNINGLPRDRSNRWCTWRATVSSALWSSIRFQSRLPPGMNDLLCEPYIWCPI